MKTQQDLQTELLRICDNVYFRKPSKGMIYPCIKYDLSGENVRYADNTPYNRRKKWTITIIDEDPNSEIPEKLITSFMYCSFDRSYQADGLNHFVYRLYF